MTEPPTPRHAELSGRALSPAGGYLAEGRRDGTVTVWDLTSGRELRTLQAPPCGSRSLALSPDNRYLARTDPDDGVTVWELATGEERFVLRGNQKVRWGMVFSPDGRRLAWPGEDRSLMVWDMADGQEVRALQGLGRPLQEVSFSPDGRRLALAATDGTVKIWNAADGQELLTLRGLPGGAVRLVFSPDGRRLAGVGGGDVVVWDARPTTQEVQREARARLEVRLHRRDAEAALTRGHWAEAVRHLDALTEAQPVVGQNWRSRGRARAELGQRDQAAADYARALALLPESMVRGSERDQLCAEVASREPLFSDTAVLRPDDAGLWVAHGRLQVLRGRWAEAAAEYARVIESAPLPTAIAPHDEAFEYACLLCLTRDDAGYRRFCRRLVERAGPKPTPVLAFVVARSCALAPEGAAEPAPAVGWAEQAVRAAPKTAWYVHALGLAHYRAGEWQQARQRFEESDAAGWGNATVLNWLGLALVHCQLGNADEARGWLRKAATWLDQAAPDSLPTTDWLEAQVLRREAEGLLKGAGLGRA